MQDSEDSPAQISATYNSSAATERAAAGSLNSAPISDPVTASAGDGSSSPCHDHHLSQIFAERKTQEAPLGAENDGEGSQTPAPQALGVHFLPHTVAQMAASQEASFEQDEVDRKRNGDLDPSDDGQVAQQKLQKEQSSDTDAHERIEAASLVDATTQATLLAPLVTPSLAKSSRSRKGRSSLSIGSSGREKRLKYRSHETDIVKRTRFQATALVESKSVQASNRFNMIAPQIPERRRSTALENMRVLGTDLLDLINSEGKDNKKIQKFHNRTHSLPVPDELVKEEDHRVVTKGKCKALPDQVCRRIAMFCYQDQNSLRALRLVNKRFNSAAGIFLFGNLIFPLAVDPILRFYSLLRSPNVPKTARLCCLNAVRDASLAASDLHKMSSYLFHSFQGLGSLRDITLDFCRMSMRSRVAGPMAIRDQEIWLAAHALLGLRSDLHRPASFTLNCIDDQDLTYISNFVRFDRLLRLKKHDSTRKHAFSSMRRLVILNWQSSTERHQTVLQRGVRSGLAKTLTELADLERLEIRGSNLAPGNLDALRAGVRRPMYVRLPTDDLGFGYGVSDMLQHLELWKVTIDASCLCRLIRRCSNTLHEVRLNVALETWRWSVVFSTLLCCISLVGFGANQDGLWVLGDNGSIRTGYLERDHGVETRTRLDREAMVLALVDRRKLNLLFLHIQDNRQRPGLPALTSVVWEQYDLLTQARQAASVLQET